MKRWSAAVIVAVTITMLAGCSSAFDSASGGGSSVPAPAVGEAPEVGNPSGVVDGADRQVVSEGHLTITAEDPIDAAKNAVSLVERSGGRIDSRIEQPPADGSGGSAQLVVRIPSPELTPTLDKVKQLGDVNEVSITATDVTATAQDLGARIAALSTSVDRLQALLTSATSTKDLVEIESALSDRQSNLESLQAQRRSLTEQVDLATISLNFDSEAAAPIAAPDSFLSGIVAGWEALLGFANAALIIFGVVLPWLLVVAILAAAILLLLRTRRRRRPLATTMEQ